MSLLRQVVRGSLVQVVVETRRVSHSCVVEKLVEIPEIRAVVETVQKTAEVPHPVHRQRVHSAAGGGGLMRGTLRRYRG